MTGGTDDPGMHCAVFDAVRAGSVFRLPNGETRHYYEDGSYVLRNGIVGVMLGAGYVVIGAAVTPPQAGAAVWRQVVPTPAGGAVRDGG